MGISRFDGCRGFLDVNLFSGISGVGYIVCSCCSIQKWIFTARCILCVVFLLRKATPVTSFLHSLKSPNAAHCSPISATEQTSLSGPTFAAKITEQLISLFLLGKKSQSFIPNNLVGFFSLANLHHKFFCHAKKWRISCEHHGYFTQ